MSRLLLCTVGLVALSFTVGCEPPRTAPAPEPENIEPPAAVEQPAAEPKMVREQAKVGVGRRGGDIPTEPTPGAILTTPTNVYFQAQEQAAFNILIPQAMQLFEASEGRAPQSEEEYFTRIIRENNIKLPDLPDGHRYVYDVEKKQLMVEHPE